MPFTSVPANPGFALLVARANRYGGQVVSRTPIVAWFLVEDRARPVTATPQRLHDSDVSAVAVLCPDGQVLEENGFRLLGNGRPFLVSHRPRGAAEVRESPFAQSDFPLG